MILERLEVGPLMANCYIVGCDATQRGFIVDPGGDAERILDTVERLGLTIDCIIDTHSHPDHVAANCAVREGLNERQEASAKLIAHEDARPWIEQPPNYWLLLNMRPGACTIDATVTDGDELTVGELTLRILHLPGHSPGSIVLVMGDRAITGDVLFAGGVGRTDFPGGDYDTLLASLKRLVTELPDETTIYPGHGPSSTIGEEKRTNEWLVGM